MPSLRRHTFSVSAAFYARLSRYCAEHGIAVSRFVDQIINAEIAKPYVERPAPARPEPSAKPITPRAAIYTCSVCGLRGHNAASHDPVVGRYEIEVSPELYELLGDLRVRARELEGVEVTRGEILERGIEKAMTAGGAW